MRRAAPAGSLSLAAAPESDRRSGVDLRVVRVGASLTPADGGESPVPRLVVVPDRTPVVEEVRPGVVVVVGPAAVVVVAPEVVVEEVAAAVDDVVCAVVVVEEVDDVEDVDDVVVVS